ncbi:substrate-binding domain-containing protein [Streptomyces sp. NPDC090088]|uniref:substrate-binding domain-containing protein n=1 Tax=Streptomyces sp. NPDC090088 TaxID=3365944 RepID=UPI003822A9D0
MLRLLPLVVVDFGALDRPARARLAAHGVPTVPAEHNLEPRPQAGQERGPQEEIAELQVRELAKRGERRIVYAALADRRPDPYGPSRFAAVTAACERRGLEAPLRVSVPLELESATAVLSGLPQDVPLGVAALDDDVALAVLAAAAQLGRPVPAALAVVGVDATDVGQLWAPRLTTIAVDMEAYVDRFIPELFVALGRPAPRYPAAGVPLLRLVAGETT